MMTQMAFIEDDSVACLTVFQPFADLLVSGVKKVENRKRRTHHRGLLLIHAGVGTGWLDKWPGPHPDDMVFGAIVGAVRVIDCLEYSAIRDGRHDREYPWLKGHEHIMGGPWCWVCERAVRFPKPVPYKGSQGIFRVPKALVADQLR